MTDFTRFTKFKGRQIDRMALEIPAGATVHLLEPNLYQYDGITFKAYQTPVAGDFICRLTDADTYHVTRAVFEERNHLPGISAPAQPALTTLSDDDKFEAEIKAKGLTAPRVTPKDLAAAIAEEFYFTAGEAIDYRPIDLVPYQVKNSDGMLPLQIAPESMHLLTFCVLVLQNGFTVVGKSACASPENFDAELGRKIARQDAVSQLWPLLGFALKQRLHEAARLNDGRPVQVDPTAEDSVDYNKP